MPINNLIDQLKRDEGEILHVYRDSRGILTAGVGHNCEAHNEGLAEGTPITQAQSDAWLAQDAATACDFVHRFLPWTDSLNDVRRAVFQNMCFNMGIYELMKFHLTLNYAKLGMYPESSKEMLDSVWATQTKDRAKRLAVQLESGSWQ